MKQRVSLLTLGVADLPRARAFYEALGWTTNAGPEDDVVFFQAGAMIVALWGREQLAEDCGLEDTRGFGGIALAHNVGSPAEVELCWPKRRRRAPRWSAPARRPSGEATRASSSTPTAIRGRSPTT